MPPALGVRGLVAEHLNDPDFQHPAKHEKRPPTTGLGVESQRGPKMNGDRSQELPMHVRREAVNPWSEEPQLALLAVKQAAGVLNLGRSTVYRLIADGRLDVVHIGRSTRVPIDAITKFITELRTGDFGDAAHSQGVTGRAEVQGP
jgi:excisionase family DNA binding protein